MRQSICLMAALLPLLSASAESLRVSTDWLQSNPLEVGSGDIAEVYCDPGGPPVELGNILWTGGRLQFEDCLIDGNGASRQSLPLTISSGQECELLRTTLSGEQTAISLQGGSLIADEVTFTTPTAIEVLDPASCVNVSNTNFSLAETALLVTQADELQFDGCVFLCNDQALNLVVFNSVSFSNCLFQANLSGLRITGNAAQISFLGSSNIFADNRDFHVENYSAQQLNLSSSLYYGRGEYGGAVNTGNMQPAGQSSLKTAGDPDPEVYGEDEVFDVVPLTWIPVVETKDGIPCKVNAYRIYQLDSAFDLDSGVLIAETEDSEYELCVAPDSKGFFVVTSVLGEWPDE